MVTLGEAFVEIKADLRPFTRDLEREVKAAVATVEKQFNAQLGTQLARDAERTGQGVGKSLGKGVSDSLGKELGSKHSSAFIGIPAALGSALDDGISAFPAEVKAAIVLGIFAATPFIAGGLAGAVAAGTGAGVAGLGVLLAFQFDDVERRGTEVARGLRSKLVDAARPFANTTLASLDLIESRFEKLDPTIRQIFRDSAEFVPEITEGLLEGLEFFLDSLAVSIDDIGPFVDELRRGLGTLGAAAGDALEIIVGTGEDGRKAFRDLIFVVGSLIVFTANLFAIFTKVYGVVRNLIQDIPVISPIIALFVHESDKAAASNSTFANTNVELTESFFGVISATSEQERELRDLVNTLEDYESAIFDSIQADVDFERSLDKLNEALQENGRTLDINQEKGRQNVEAFLRGIKDAEDAALRRVERGTLNAQQAAALYDQEIALIRQLAREIGITDQEFQALFGDAIAVAGIRISSADIGVPAIASDAANAAAQARELLAQLRLIQSFRLPAQGVRPFSELADGGIVYGPTPAIVGEAGREVVIPLEQPNRAAQLAQQSGLTQLLGLGGATTVLVYIGSEQLEARMVRVVEQNSRSQSLALAHGPR